MKNTEFPCVALTLVMALAPSFAGAQESSLGVTESAAAGDIVVTARRREERLDRVPLSVSVVSATAIANQHLGGVQDVQYLTPSLTVTTNTDRGANNYTLRGQGTTYGTDPSVVAYFAEVPVPGGGNSYGAMFDMGSVQVLNGPQGTLFGRNSVGGAILFSPVRPSNKPEGHIRATYGNLNNAEIEAVGNMPVVDDKVLLRVGFQHRSRDGFTHDVLTGVDYDNVKSFAARMSLLVRPSATFENLTIFNHSRFDSNGSGIKLNKVNPASPAAAVFPTLAALADQQAQWGVRRTALSADSIEKQELTQLVNITTMDLADKLRLKNIISYTRWRSNRRHDVDGSPLPVLDYRFTPGWGGVQPNNQPAIDQLTEELQLSGSLAGGALDFTAGGYYQHNDPKHSLARQQFFGGLPTREDRGDKLTSLAGYGQATLNVGTFVTALEGLRLTGGYRYTHDKRRDYSNIYIPTGATPADGGPCALIANVYPNCRVDYARNFSAGTYTAAVEYQVTPTVMVYATARSGFKSGGFNLGAPPVPEFSSFEPERVKDVEAGIKGNVPLGGGTSLRFSAAAFRDKYTNIQRPLLKDFGGNVSVYVVNATEATIKGIEAQASLTLPVGLTVGATYSYLHSKYGDFNTLQGNFTGFPLPYTPKHKLSLTGEYRADLGADKGTFRIGAVYSWQSSYLNLDAIDPDVVIPQYGLLNMNAGIDSVLGSRFDLSVFASNLTKKKYVIGAGNYYNALGFTTLLYGEPRTYGLSLTYHFE